MCNLRKNVPVLFLFLFVAGLLCDCIIPHGALGAPVPNERSVRSPVQGLPALYGQLPLYFIENRGQVHEGVKFYQKGEGHVAWFGEDGIFLTLCEDFPGRASARRHPSERSTSDLKTPVPSATTVRLIPKWLKEQDSSLSALEPQTHKVNSFIGKDPRKWVAGVPTYNAIAYQGNEIDLKFYADARRLEYDVIVKPGADPSLVRFECMGVEKLEVNGNGELVISLPDGKTLVQKQPYIYQEISGTRVAREGKFTILYAEGHREFGFEIGWYDRELPLVIDPVLVYSTYLGGSGDDYARAVAVDSAGCAYVAGNTFSFDFPTASPYQATSTVDTVFVAKLNAEGTGLVYSTYIGGGGGPSYGMGIALDGGSAVVAGYTKASDFPIICPVPGQGTMRTPVSIEGEHNSTCFVTKLSASGDTLVYSTYLGGTNEDEALAVAVDADGNAYIAGTTISADFPATNSAYLKTKRNSADAFVTKLGPLQSHGSSSYPEIVYSTYLGGRDMEWVTSIAVNSAGEACVGGVTYSDDFPSYRALSGQSVKKGTSESGFITQLNTSGSSLVFSTFLGGTGNEGDGIYALALDASNGVYVTGDASSDDFPILNAFQQQKPGSHSAFVTKLTVSPGYSAQLAYSTFLGGSGTRNNANCIAVDSRGNAHVAGTTNSKDFPLLDPVCLYPDNADTMAFITKLTATGVGLLYSTYLGGSGGDSGRGMIIANNYVYGIAIDRADYAYIAGYSSSSVFPTKNAFQSAMAGELSANIGDAIIARLQDTGTHDTPQTGMLRVDISPKSAISAGALWNVDGGEWQKSGTTFTGLALGTHQVRFSSVSGWTSPSSVSVTVELYRAALASATYTQNSSSNSGTGSTGTTGLWLPYSSSSSFSSGDREESRKDEHASPNNSGQGYHPFNLKDDAASDKKQQTTGSAAATPQTGVTVSGGGNDSGQNTVHDVALRTGTVQVTIQPPGAVAAGAKWRIDNKSWNDGDVLLNGVTENAGTPRKHVVEFKPMLGWESPPPQKITVHGDNFVQVAGEYSPTVPGSLKLTISPPEAVSAGAKWRVDFGSWYKSGETVPLNPGTHSITYTNMPGWAQPSTDSVKVESRKQAAVDVSYSRPSLSVTGLSETSKLTAGKQQLINWNYTGDIGPRVRIELLNRNSSRVLAESAPSGESGTGSFEVVLPRDLKAGSGYRIRVAGLGDSPISGKSPAFSVVKGK